MSADLAAVGRIDVTVFIWARKEGFFEARAQTVSVTAEDRLICASDRCESRDRNCAVAYALSELAERIYRAERR